MKNKTLLIFAVSILLFVVLGCGVGNLIKSSTGSEQTNVNSSSSEQNKTNPENESSDNEEVVETTNKEGKIGVPECDDVFEMLTEQMQPKEDESYITKATRQTILNSMRESFKESIKDEKDRQKLATQCGKYLEQLKKYKTEEEQKNKK